MKKRGEVRLRVGQYETMDGSLATIRRFDSVYKQYTGSVDGLNSYIWNLEGKDINNFNLEWSNKDLRLDRDPAAPHSPSARKKAV